MSTLTQPAQSIATPPLPKIDVAAVESGVSLETMTDFLESSGLELKDIYNVVIPARTLSHRRARNENLSVDESDKLARVVRVFEHTQRVFGSTEKTLKFLRTPKQRFDGRTPLDMLRTDLGGRLMEEWLWQIADGVFV